MDLEPKLVQQFGDYYLLWFSKSNSYSCVDRLFYYQVKSFLKSTNHRSFYKELKELGFRDSYTQSDIQHAYKRVYDFLHHCNQSQVETTEELTECDPKLELPCVHFYQSAKAIVQIDYASETVRNYIHPIISHLEISNKKIPIEAGSHLKIYTEHQKLVLVKNGKIIGTYPFQDYHKLQGKFLMEFINEVHNKDESDWIGLLHASAIQYKGESILCIGDSGSGKSTLVSLLAAQGFDLVADDTVPLLADDLNIYSNPAAVSIKKTALDVVSEYWTIKESMATSELQPRKGLITYIPMQHNLIKLNFPCRIVVHVKYVANSKTSLQPMDFAQALNLIIEQSWLSPNTNNVKSFFAWLTKVTFFELTYSNFLEVKTLFAKLITEQPLSHS